MCVSNKERISLRHKQEIFVEQDKQDLLLDVSLKGLKSDAETSNLPARAAIPTPEASRRPSSAVPLNSLEQQPQRGILCE